MENLLEFLDRYTFDRQFYWLLLAADQKRQFEIRWQKDEKMHWSFRLKGDLFWKMVKTEDLLQSLSREGLDLKLFEERVRTSVLEQVVFAEFMAREARSIFTEDVIQNALNEHEVFMEQIREVISRLVQEKSAPSQNIPLKSSSTTNHLRLV